MVQITEIVDIVLKIVHNKDTTLLAKEQTTWIIPYLVPTPGNS